MIRALYSAASGMTAQQMNVDNIAHNLANANTSGFKARRAQFQDLMYQTVVQPGSASGQQTTVPTGLQLGLGTRTSSNEILFTQGSFSQTDNPLDMVIQGKGFFQIRRASGELAYTRSGAFHLDKDGSLVTQDGNPLEPQITVPSAAQQISIGQDGTPFFDKALVRPEHRKQLAKLLTADGGDGEPVKVKPKGQLPETLRRDLAAERLPVAQVEIARNPAIALDPDGGLHGGARDGLRPRRGQSCGRQKSAGEEACREDAAGCQARGARA